MNCPICNTNEKNIYRCEYKFEIHEDKKYFGDLKIYRCNKCDFSYANPMPKNEDLNFFYENIYRLPFRPPYWISENDQDLEKKFLQDRNLNYLLYLSTLIDLKKIENIYDFGAGIGDLGYAIKKKFSNVNLYCTEYDKHCLNILKKRGYNNLEIKEINKKFDLIITTHSLEHLTDVEIFKQFNKMLKPEGLLFFEIPYCPDEYFLKRPYDGPHLLFYTKNSIKEISSKYNFEIIRIDTSSYSFDEDYKLQKESQDRYYKIRSGKFFTFKQIIKKIVPKIFLKIRQKFLNSQSTDEMIKLGQFTSNSNNNTYLRGILKKID